MAKILTEGTNFGKNNSNKGRGKTLAGGKNFSKKKNRSKMTKI